MAGWVGWWVFVRRGMGKGDVMLVLIWCGGGVVCWRMCGLVGCSYFAHDKVGLLAADVILFDD